ncbi:MAG: DUF308 domain-containing protein [Gammaproteobacteria bacterium]|jgi:uncharacterized membrane protein HdeD (DUF308 family)|nr:DUF308 domain-containing protein [Gammaproteobacteria bacterium]
MRASGTGIGEHAGRRHGKVWWSFLLRGLIAGALGLCALIWPSASLNILLRLVGLYLLADGVLGLIAAYRSFDRTPYLVQAAISLIIGATLLFWPGATVKTLFVIFGIWALLSGIMQIVTSRQSRPDDPDRGLMTGIGTVAAIVGLVLIFWPGTGVVAIAWVIAAAAFVIAALLIFLAMRLKRLSGRIEQLRSDR